MDRGQDQIRENSAGVRRRLIASGALELTTEMGGTAFGSEDPGADGPGRIMTDMLGVAAFEVGDPVAFGVLMESDDFARCHFRNMP